MIHESPESILKQTITHRADSWGTGTADSAAIDNKGKGNFLFVLNFDDTATATLAISVLHRDVGGSFAIATDDAGDPITVNIAASTSSRDVKIRVRADRLKDEVGLRVVVGVAANIFHSRCVQTGLDSADCDGAAAYDILV